VNLLKFGSFLQANEIAVDLGTANTLIYVKGAGIVPNETASVGDRKGDRTRSRGIGLEAKRMSGARPRESSASALKDGVIADFDVTEKMLRYFLNDDYRQAFFRE